MLNYFLNYSMNNMTILLKCCMMTSCIPAFIFTLHVLPFFVLAPFLPAFSRPSSLPPSLHFLSVNSGSNETSIWPVRKTQTSLPLWGAERRTCWGRRAKRIGIKEKKIEDGRVLQTEWMGDKVFSTPDQYVHPSSHVPSIWRAVLIADFKTAQDKKISRDIEKMWEIIKGILVLDEMEPRVPKPQ